MALELGKPKKQKRFIKASEESLGFGSTTQILIDSETGVNYIFHVNGYAGGLTPLLDANGKPIVSSIYDLYE